MATSALTLLPRPPRGSKARKKLEARVARSWREMVDNDLGWEDAHKRVIRHFSRATLDRYFTYRRACMRFRVGFAVLTAPHDEPVRTKDLCEKLAAEYSTWFTRGEFYEACTVVSLIIQKTAPVSLRVVHSYPRTSK